MDSVKGSCDWACRPGVRLFKETASTPILLRNLLSTLLFFRNTQHVAFQTAAVSHTFLLLLSPSTTSSTGCSILPKILQDPQHRQTPQRCAISSSHHGPVFRPPAGHDCRKGHALAVSSASVDITNSRYPLSTFRLTVLMPPPLRSSAPVASNFQAAATTLSTIL